MNNPIELDQQYFVTDQLAVSDITVLKEHGFERIINNRPELEADDQPKGDTLRIAAEALGMEYVANPVDLSKLSKVEVDLQASVLKSDKKTLAFCRTGTRSSVLWVLTENAKGKSYDELVAQVNKAGFDLTRCVPAMAPLIQN